MTMQYDVKSVHASAAGSLVGSRCRLKGISVAPPISSLTTFELRDGGSSGAILAQFDLPANSNPNSFYVLVPGEGILFSTTLHLTISAGSLTGLTVFYG
jgi:hypothetical protein